MSNFVNFLKNIVSGVFSFLGGLFSSKKSQAAIAEAAPKPRKVRNSGYFLELDDAKGVGSAVTPVQTLKQEPARAEVAKAATQPKQAKPTAEPKAAPKPATVNAGLNLPQPTVTTFAPKYLAPNGSANGRRRPGANMSSFLDMARQVKTAN